MKRKIGINADCIKNGFTYGNIKKLRDLGFEGMFIAELKGSFGKYKDIAESVGMDFEFIHAPFDGINSMWLEGDEYLRIFNRIKLAIDHASANGVPVVIVHLSSGWNPPEPTELGFSRFDKLIEYAASKRVTVAIENLRNKENLLMAMERYKDNESVRYCYDAGHEYCYTPGVDWISIFADKLICTHIHDNTGFAGEKDNDTHYLPFDGTLDYADMIRRLDKIGYQGTLTLEVFNSTKPEYSEMTEEEFFAECAARIKRIAEM
ncbi:MAG: sugar phosphate isomerase/epimerase [Clostridia bacterium]|nr:sugar phosphate isomerase/epimerase [Clostridia bacterium]